MNGATCKFCKATGLAWFRTPSGRWFLATPPERGSKPLPADVHTCRRASTSSQSWARREAASWARRSGPVRITNTA